MESYPTSAFHCCANRGEKGPQERKLSERKGLQKKHLKEGEKRGAYVEKKSGRILTITQKARKEKFFRKTKSEPRGKSATLGLSQKKFRGLKGENQRTAHPRSRSGTAVVGNRRKSETVAYLSKGARRTKKLISLTGTIKQEKGRRTTKIGGFQERSGLFFLGRAKTNRRTHHG